MEWRNLYRGVLMGITDLIPGISGGTIAVMLGIYERLLTAISGFFSSNWRRQIGFLIPLALGMGSALLIFSRLIKYLLEHHYEPTQFFFIGLVIGVLPLLLKQSDARRNFRPIHVIMLIISGALVASLAFFNADKTGLPIDDRSALTLLGLFFSGWLASMAMLLPGISGSFVLLMLGVYPTAIHALSSLDFLLIAVIGAGVMIGFVVSSKGIKLLLSRYANLTYALMIGMIMGSVAVMYPGLAGDTATILICVLTFVLGLATTLVFGLRKKA
ncbi:DUF368 domain-containing protein [Paenibacillus paeoniae]|uniref:DUF368 domain-containing protein n=1 Tax=Paenibacillus paeoniae TaxID=2292705 RepID=A0A371P6J5_9BACL|nr:DUF368 domain-containing protein [Paenibacillus paeoniae]REK71505.1 DUF368 domain-containing protein [Paenibacillus paeoniae]